MPRVSCRSWSQQCTYMARHASNYRSLPMVGPWQCLIAPLGSTHPSHHPWVHPSPTHCCCTLTSKAGCTVLNAYVILSKRALVDHRFTVTSYPRVGYQLSTSRLPVIQESVYPYRSQYTRTGVSIPVQEYISILEYLNLRICSS